MDIAHSVALLNAHAGVLEAEIVRIEADIEALHNVAERYCRIERVRHVNAKCRGRTLAAPRQQTAAVR
jgi:hypothetical protein